MAVLTTVGLVLPVTSALAADPGRWKLTTRSTLPLYYYQGVSDAPGPGFLFNGVHLGLYRTDAQLRETARNDDVIPLSVHVAEQYNHIGDIDYDGGEGGRVLLPLECYYPRAAPGQADENNTCNTGSVGVADPNTLAWRYYVKLDPAEIPKVMWNEVSPDGTLLWTQTGKDLLAYRMSDITRANAAPLGPKLKSVRRLRGAVPPSGITGAAFKEGRLYAAGGNAQPFQIWSIDLTDGSRRLEIEQTITGESEGITFMNALGGELHWLIQPYNTSGAPTYGVSNGTLLSYLPAATAGSGPSPSATATPSPQAGGTRCLARGAPVSGRGIGAFLLGERSSVMGQRLGRPPGATAARFRYCITGGGRLSVAFSRGRARLIASSGRAQKYRGVGVGTSRDAMRRVFPRARALYRGFWLTAPGSGIAFALKGSIVRAVVVVDRGLEKAPAELRRHLRSAGP